MKNGVLDEQAGYEKFLKTAKGAVNADILEKHNTYSILKEESIAGDMDFLQDQTDGHSFHTVVNAEVNNGVVTKVAQGNYNSQTGECSPVRIDEGDWIGSETTIGVKGGQTEKQRFNP